jgi:hypothetical protein
MSDNSKIEWTDATTTILPFDRRFSAPTTVITSIAVFDYYRTLMPRAQGSTGQIGSATMG